jgi:hypothetical protein
LALSLNATQLAGWEIAEPHVRENTNKQVQVFIMFFIIVAFKSLLAQREIPTPPPDAAQAFFKNKSNYLGCGLDLGHDSYGVRGVTNDFWTRLETPHSKTFTRHSDALGQALGFSGSSGHV